MIINRNKFADCKDTVFLSNQNSHSLFSAFLTKQSCIQTASNKNQKKFKEAVTFYLTSRLPDVMTTELFKKDILPVKDKLYRLALRMLTNPAEAQDAVQEVLLKLWQQGEALHKIDNLEAWAIRITKNWCLDKLRSKHRRIEDLDQAPVQTDSAPSPQEKLEKKEMHLKVRQMIQQLPSKQMIVLQLRDIEGMTYREIEQAIDMPQNQIKVNLFRARQKLKALMTKKINYEA